MPAPDQQSVEMALATVTAPHLDVPLTDVATINLQQQANVFVVDIQMSYPVASLQGQITEQARQALAQLCADQPLQINLIWQVEAPKQAAPKKKPVGAKHLIAVASGKGGVGKSVTAVNLALALHAEGATVGLLDADIYGPSQGQMLGVAKDIRPEVKEGKWFEPILAHGIQSMSMSYLVTKRTPLVWRGPMVSGALRQMLEQTLWHELDYLIIDMPPGTGDIQLTLTQSVSVSGAIIVTTPQEIALLDARRAIEMFAKVKVLVLGVVENMSFYVCPCCGDQAQLFGADGGRKLTTEYNTSLLGRLPLTPAIGAQTDSGQAPLIVEPDGEIANLYKTTARHMAAVLSLQLKVDLPIISIDDS